MNKPTGNDHGGADGAQHAETPSPTPEAANLDAAAPGFRIGNVLKVILPLLLVAAGAFAFFGLFDGSKWLSSRMNPPLVMAKGQVIYQGQPLEGAQISTRHTSGKLTQSIGWTDEEGRFTLRTDIDGYIDGAYAGEHQVLVTAHEIINAPAAPPLLTPAKYASFATTPLRIVVSPVPEENEYVLNLEGGPPERPNANSSRAEFDPDEVADRIFETYDKDQDGRISSEEIEAIDGKQGARSQFTDANEDGIIERDELIDGLARPE